LTLPYEFTFENGCNDARSIEIFNIFIHLCILPAEQAAVARHPSDEENLKTSKFALEGLVSLVVK
jgi:hypothetical protein